MCLTTITKKTRGKGEQLRWAYHVFVRRQGTLQAIYSHGMKTYLYKTNTLHVSDALHGRRSFCASISSYEYPKMQYIANFHSFVNEAEARQYFQSLASDTPHCELRKIRAWEINVEGTQHRASVIVHRKMYIPRGGQYIVCRNR